MISYVYSNGHGSTGEHLDLHRHHATDVKAITLPYCEHNQTRNARHEKLNTVTVRN